MKKLILAFALTFFATSQLTFASDFMDKYSGKQVNCQVGYLSDELFKGFPFKVDFKLVKLVLKFDDKKGQDFYQRTLNLNPEDLFILTYDVIMPEGVLTSHFVMEKRLTNISYPASGGEIISYATTQKHLEIRIHDGLLVDKYVFYKNHKKLFTCSKLSLLK